jgi:transposase
MAQIKVIDPVSVPVSVLSELNDLRDQVAALLRENERLHKDNERLQRELVQARAALAQAQRQGKRQAAPFAKGPPKPHPKPPGRKAGAAHGRHGHRRAPSPATVDVVLEAPLPDACPHCGGSVQETTVRPQYQTEIPRRPLVRQFNVHLGHCRDCGQRLQGRHPLQTSDALGAAASQVGPDAQAAAATLNKTFGLSHVKVSKVFKALFGIDLTRGAVAQVVLRAAARLEAADAEVCQELKAATRLTPDETGWRVGGKPAWLHAWVTQRAVAYAIEGHRHAGALEQLIGRDWAGKMTHDGFSTYQRFTEATHQQCLGHLLRRLRELASQARAGAVHYPRRLIALFTEALQLRNRYLKGEVSAQALREARVPLESRLARLVLPAREVPAYQTLSAHLAEHLEQWFTFLDHPEVEPTNWEGEQAIRPAVVNRKVWGGNRTWPGAHAQEVLMSVLETCRRNGRAGMEFVSQTLRAFGNPQLPRPVLINPR